MNEKALKEALRYVCETGYITVDTREKTQKFIDGEATFDIFDNKNKKELSIFYQDIQRIYMALTNEFLPNIFNVEGIE